MNLWLDIAATLAMLAVAILAIWGDFFRSWLTGPRLRVSLLNSEGELTEFNTGQAVRYYHLTVSNLRRWSPARNERVVVTQVTRFALGAAGPMQPLSGALQLTWRFPQHQPQFQTIGPDYVCDLGLIPEGGPFKLSTYINPNNFDASLSKGDRLSLVVAAVADNAESPLLELDLAWDGIWHLDGNTMRRHPVVRQRYASDRSQETAERQRP